MKRQIGAGVASDFQDPHVLVLKNDPVALRVDIGGVRKLHDARVLAA
jgi:hypothetical protein